MNEANRVLLIDLDNCPRQIDNLPEALGEFTRVIACHRAGGDPKVPLSLITLLAGAIEAGRLRIVAMPRSGKNAADFGLTFWAGHLAAELPEQTAFVILSKDHDLDHAVDMLRSIGRQAERVPGSSSAPSGNGSPSSQPDHQSANEYWHYLAGFSSNRPARKKTLLKSIRGFFKPTKSAVRPADVLASLLERGLVQIGNGSRVTYHQEPGDHHNPGDQDDDFESDPFEDIPLRDGDIPF